jgi:hypothetical protein
MRGTIEAAYRRGNVRDDERYDLDMMSDLSEFVPRRRSICRTAQITAGFATSAK